MNVRTKNAAAGNASANSSGYETPNAEYIANESAR